MQVITLLYRGSPLSIFIIVALLTFFGLFSLYRKSKLKQWEREDEHKRNIIKKKGKKITIPFEDIKIVSFKHKIDAGRAVSSWDDRNNTRFDFGHDRKDVVVEYFSIQYKYRDMCFESSPVIMDRKTLEIKLYMQKEIHLYHDELTGDYFFDLGFFKTKPTNKEAFLP